MYYLLSLMAGVIISVMITLNGELTAQYGLYTATVIPHIGGLLMITAWTLIKREKPFAKRHPWYLYIGGSIGVITTVFNNLAFGRISLSAILALGLLGQSIGSLITDQYGWMGMSRHPFKKHKIIGLAIVAAGIAVMLDRFEIVAVFTSFAAGASIVVSRTLNARFGALTSVRVSTFFNYLVGLLVSIPVLLLLGRQEPGFIHFTVSPDWYIYLGGFAGVCAVFLSNVLVVKISALYLSLLMFTGQVFAGVLIDAMIAQEFSLNIFVGGVLVTAGLCANLLLDHFMGRKTPKEG